MKKIIFILTVLLLPLSSFALTKPSPDTDLESLSYVFYLYYDKGQIFFDKDYNIGFDVINEKFSGSLEATPAPGSYRIVIENFKAETIINLAFDPQQGNASLSSGKIQVKVPYVSDGMWVRVYDRQDKGMSMYIGMGSICNDDGFCDAGAGENDKNCQLDCKKQAPKTSVAPPPLFDAGDEYTMIIVYAVSGLAIALGSWFGWKWWKKKKEESFLPGASSESSSGPSVPLPPIQ